MGPNYVTLYYNKAALSSMFDWHELVINFANYFCI